ncbi:membrane protein [Agaricicola taiwanensis]|uniref:Membrane protein n=1 Tax=Agaricicola taiwanensis TaxID=591372 RepID=A0A8J2YLU6_9RHOB|nr:tripartite tricarboxylate transporter TctB family protein [Agaricicola taiwanensis]GGE52532.1 membrane protein [Agaricicola taiwanensis]
MYVTKGFLAGLLFMVFGGGAAAIAFTYRMGTATQMGPGYFPALLGVVVMAIGLVMAIRAYLSPEGSEPAERLHLRPMVLILAGVVAFGLLIRSWGLAPAIAALLVFGRMAGREGGPIEFILMLVVLTVLPIIVFIYGLRIPLEIWAQ